ncbi:hypothetical protein LLUC08_1153 [Lactococcus lactis subsp. lactis]|jgi:hypothetical protein|uniref:Uncharacterized protein n=1 Tax=Lactococcus lactis subsp. lactis TaxID=1360 RepID=A0AAC9R662_LACLL|nr:hypothetical protein [Lactococcus lactis]ARE13485.1 hypothetical protein LLUC11_1152 [Lactococcus lactis subsp. lactis]ARE15895.1 hypothetical protein LLUC08_1153 [Lactococcus lactis subsp. lactis]
MINKKNVSLFVLIATGVVIVLVLIGIFAVGKINKQVATNKASHSQSISISKERHDSQKSSSQNHPSGSKSSSDDSNKHMSEKEVLAQFLEDFSTVKLDNDSISHRAEDLKKSMTETAYQANYIEQDSDELKSLLSKYEKTKQIDTSNSTQLVSKHYLESNLYLNANVPGQYYVELYYTAIPVYETKGYTMQAKYNVTVVDNKINSLELISQQSVPKK